MPGSFNNSLKALQLRQPYSIEFTHPCPWPYPTDWLEAFISLRESTSAHLEKVSVAAKMNRCPLDDGGG